MPPYPWQSPPCPAGPRGLADGKRGRRARRPRRLWWRVAQPHLPGAEDCIAGEGIAPPWAVWVGGLLPLVVSSVLVARRGGGSAARGGRVVAWAGWTGCGLLLWSAAGLVFGAFRAFFWMTGTPAGDFSRVDRAGFLTCAAAFTATALPARAIRSVWRAVCGGCVRCAAGPPGAPG